MYFGFLNNWGLFSLFALVSVGFDIYFGYFLYVNRNIGQIIRWASLVPLLLLFIALLHTMDILKEYKPDPKTQADNGLAFFLLIPVMFYFSRWNIFLILLIPCVYPLYWSIKTYSDESLKGVLRRISRIVLMTVLISFIFVIVILAFIIPGIIFIGR